MRLLRKAALGAALTSAMVVVSASAARADVILTLGNVPQTDENVLLNSGDIGNPIYGETNNTGFAVRFTGIEDLKAPSSGQARIEAADDAFTYLKVDIPDGSFTSLILNIDSTATGTLDFRALDTDGQEFLFSNTAIGGSGANFFTFTTINGQRISFVEFTADVPVTFVDAAQFRIGGAQRTTTVPEPASLLLMGTAAAGLVARRVRRRRA
jgi:hypothetical protein